MRSLALLLAAAVVLCAITRPASAGLVLPEDFPGLALKINDHGQGPPTELQPKGIAIASGKYKAQFSGEALKANKWRVQYEVMVDPDPIVHLAIAVTNLQPTAQNFSFTVLLPIFPALTAGTLTGGSISGALIDANNDGTATLTSVGVLPLYTARCDGVDHQYLLTGSPTFSVAGSAQSATFGPDDFGLPIPSFVGPAQVLNTIEVQLDFRVSAGDSVVAVADLVVNPVPEPGTMLVLLVLAGLLLHRPALRLARA